MVVTFTPTRMGIYENKTRKNIDTIRTELATEFRVSASDITICNLNLFNWSDWTGAAYTRSNYKVIGTDGYSYYGFGFDSDSKRFTRAWSSENSQRNFFGCWDAIVDGKANQSPIPVFTTGARRRTIIGMTSDGKIGIYANDVPEYPEVMKTNLLQHGFVEAVLLDGGGSTQLRSPMGNVYSSDGRAVHTLFWAIPEKKTSSCPYTKPTRNIGLFSVGEGAKWVQWHLWKAGFLPDEKEVDGLFFTKSWKALIAYQGANGLSPDGVAGPKTFEKMES